MRVSAKRQINQGRCWSPFMACILSSIWLFNWSVSRCHFCIHVSQIWVWFQPLPERRSRIPNQSVRGWVYLDLLQAEVQVYFFNSLCISSVHCSCCRAPLPNQFRVYLAATAWQCTQPSHLLQEPFLIIVYRRHGASCINECRACILYCQSAYWILEDICLQNLWDQWHQCTFSCKRNLSMELPDILHWECSLRRMKDGYFCEGVNGFQACCNPALYKSCGFL